MEFAATFGSLGDIIAICQITIQLSRALGIGTAGASSSAWEYQELRKEIDIFINILLNVVATCEQYTSPSLSDLNRTIHTIVQDCHIQIQEILHRFVPKYHESLKPGGSTRKIVDAFKKLEWTVKEKERTRELQDKLHTNGQKLSMLMLIVSRQSAHANNATLLARIEEVSILVSKQEQHQNVLLDRLNRTIDHFQRQENQIDAIEHNIEVHLDNNNTILTIAKSTIDPIKHLEQLLANVAHDVVQLRETVSNSNFIRSLDPTREMPLNLNDAFGRDIAIPLQLIIDWQSFNTILGILFQSQKGHDMVLKQQFALEEHFSGKDIARDSPLSECIRRGMRIDMSMIFETNIVLLGACPRCREDTDAPENVTIQ
ncbi:hypothetical protein BKA67DRAFT_176692 [Truncatella angustata]|uniref:Ubiquitin-like domain-containing protein n=1 Tax=Truncatella angustata TaxID=152316 RepID=A0A9P8URN2_9PEZI|nr:uncharacterized protein BKA67DRAFT_176692 [Truncatella angustata]KAH6656979.1 hypothetical protein BKA67DRAFT_176692 [Truncatella angustata]